MAEALRVNHEIRIPAEELVFSFARSSGPGGQAVNKVNSKALLRWNAAASPSLPSAVKHRFLGRFGSRLTAEGEIVLSSGESRSQRSNQEACLEKLKSMILSVAVPPKRRIPTRPGKGARERRKESKRRQGEKKRQRARGSWE